MAGVSVTVCRALGFALGLLTGCAGPGPVAVGAKGNMATRAEGVRAISPRDALHQIVVGASAKPDVVAALGEAIVVRFDSGYEVWVYRWPGTARTVRASTELVVLFDPSGRATKVRLRPGYAERER